MGHIVLLLFSFFTEAVILWQYASSLFTSSYSSKIRLALLSALYTILFLLSLLEQTGLNVVSFFVFNTVFLYMLFKLKLLLALFHSAILTAIMGISEIAVLGITSRFFPHFLLETDVELVFYTVFSKIFFFAVIYLLIHLFKGKKSNQEQYDHNSDHNKSCNCTLLAHLIVTIMIMLFEDHCGNNTDDWKQERKDSIPDTSCIMDWWKCDLIRSDVIMLLLWSFFILT